MFNEQHIILIKIFRNVKYSRQRVVLVGLFLGPDKSSEVVRTNIDPKFVVFIVSSEFSAVFAIHGREGVKNKADVTYQDFAEIKWSQDIEVWRW